MTTKPTPPLPEPNLYIVFFETSTIVQQPFRILIRPIKDGPIRMGIAIFDMASQKKDSEDKEAKALKTFGQGGVKAFGPFALESAALNCVSLSMTRGYYLLFYPPGVLPKGHKIVVPTGHGGPGTNGVAIIAATSPGHAISQCQNPHGLAISWDGPFASEQIAGGHFDCESED